MDRMSVAVSPRGQGHRYPSQHPTSNLSDAFRHLITTQTAEDHERTTQRYKSNYIRKVWNTTQARWSVSAHGYRRQKEGITQGQSVNWDFNGDDAALYRMQGSRTSLGLKRDCSNTTLPKRESVSRRLLYRRGLSNAFQKLLAKTASVATEKTELTTTQEDEICMEDSLKSGALSEIQLDDLYQTAVDESKYPKTRKEDRVADHTQDGTHYDIEATIADSGQKLSKSRRESLGKSLRATDADSPRLSIGQLVPVKHRTEDLNNGQQSVLPSHEAPVTYQPLQKLYPPPKQDPNTFHFPEGAVRSKSVPIILAPPPQPREDRDQMDRKKRLKMTRRERRKGVLRKDAPGARDHHADGGHHHHQQQHRLSTVSLHSAQGEATRWSAYHEKGRGKISTRIWAFLQTYGSLLVDPSSRSLTVRELVSASQSLVL